MRESKESAIERIMRGLKCSREEAEEVYQHDYAIDHNEKTAYEITPEQKKVEREMRQTGTRKVPTTYKFGKKKSKPNEIKELLTKSVYDFFSEYAEIDIKNLHIAEKNGKICFKINEKWYTFALTEHVRSIPKWIKEKT